MVLNAYKEAWKQAGSQGSRRTEIEHFEFLEDVLSIGTSRNAKMVLNIIRKLKPELEAML